MLNFSAEGNFTLFIHKTSELSKLIKGCEFITAMNIHKTVYKKIAKENCVAVASNFSEVPLLYHHFSLHAKVLINDKHLLITTANVSPSNLLEVSVLFDRKDVKDFEEQYKELILSRRTL